MFYPGLGKRQGEWAYNDGANGLAKLYDGKLIENIVQHLARVFIMQVALRMLKHTERLLARLVLQSHDELVYCVRDEHVEILRRLLHHEMTTPSDWCPALPLKTDVKVGPNYGEMK
jgi:DNA polymerase I-like protein with 3'-5' exonuclease and polymerase domains